MRILHIITSLRSGGAERLVLDMLPRLQNKGHEVEVYVFDATRTNFYNKLESKGIKIHNGGTGAWQMWNPLHAFQIWKLLRKGRYDIVHTHNTPAQLLTVLAKGKWNTHFVTTEHNTTNLRRNWKWYSKIDRDMYGKYDHIICISEPTKEKLLERIGRTFDSRLSVITNGIDLKNFASAQFGKRTGDQCVILMAGAFRKQKDQATLIRAMKHLDDSYILWLAGGWKGRRKCMRIARELKISHKVVFLGERSDIPQLLSQTDIAVLSSHYEGLPLSAIEAMASGRPLIASDVPGLKETVEGAGLLFNEGNDRQLADLIKQINTDHELRVSVVNKCLERAKQYNIDITVERYANLYQTLHPK